jgi:RNA polymerase sigma-70 factor (ECF subfamily)
MDAAAGTTPGAFFDAHYSRVFRFVAGRTGASREDVEDLVQETLLEAWKGRGRFRGEAALYTWILAIARNRILMGRRSAGRRHERERVARALAEVETSPVPGELLETEELRFRIRRALEALDPELAGLLIRRYYEGRAVREIAEERGETEKAVEARLHRAREEFRIKLKEEPGDGE